MALRQTEENDVSTVKRVTENEEETLRLAWDFARTLGPGSVVVLTGDLGAGKTVFARGVARALGIDDSLTSPTFTLIHEYPLPVDDGGEIGADEQAAYLYHMDLYRINDIAELREIGIEDYLYGDGICLVEWGEKLGGLSPGDAVTVTLRHLGPSRREILIERKVSDT